ncbi:hypothetical protein PV433_18465 [Paenibacillus sp. GYB004]
MRAKLDFAELGSRTQIPAVGYEPFEHALRAGEPFEIKTFQWSNQGGLW